MVGKDKPLPHVIAFGQGTLLASHPDFVNGFQAGHLAYMAAVKLHPEAYTDDDLVELFLDKLEDMQLSSLYGVGFAVGWLNTLATKGKQGGGTAL